MIASLNKRPNFRMLFLLAADFVLLDYREQFWLGIKYGIIEYQDAVLDYEELEEVVFTGMVDGHISNFAMEINTMIYKQVNDEPS